MRQFIIDHGGLPSLILFSVFFPLAFSEFSLHALSHEWGGGLIPLYFQRRKQVQLYKKTIFLSSLMTEINFATAGRFFVLKIDKLSKIMAMSVGLVNCS